MRLFRPRHNHPLQFKEFSLMDKVTAAERAAVTAKYLHMWHTVSACMQLQIDVKSIQRRDIDELREECVEKEQELDIGLLMTSERR